MAEPAREAKGLSFISNRQRLKEGTFCRSELAGIEPTPSHSASPVQYYVVSTVEEEREALPEPGPPAACGRKRTHGENYFPWRFATPQALNSSGEQIFYPVNDNQDGKWRGGWKGPSITTAPCTS